MLAPAEPVLSLLMNTGESSPPAPRSTCPFDRLSRDGQNSFRKIGGERVG
jgi:hypothetical protein